MIHLDPRRDGVQVPGHLKDDPVLRLNLAYGFNIPGLHVDDQGVFAMLSFGGHRFGCTLPWVAVFALTMPEEAHRGVVWPEDLPTELAPFFSAAGVEGGAQEVSLEAVHQPVVINPSGPSLTVVADEDHEEEADGPTDPPPDDLAAAVGPAGPTAVEPATVKRPTLRLVK